LARQCEVQLSYAIGHAGPISVGVHTFGTAILDEQELTRRVEAVFDFRLGAIIREFNLRHLPALHPAGFYQHLPVNGHFGGSGKKLPWENTDKAESLR
jgi:S-adenosylmethionine synthetase